MACDLFVGPNRACQPLYAVHSERNLTPNGSLFFAGKGPPTGNLLDVSQAALTPLRLGVHLTHPDARREHELTIGLCGQTKAFTETRSSQILGVHSS